MKINSIKIPIPQKELFSVGEFQKGKIDFKDVLNSLKKEFHSPDFLQKDLFKDTNLAVSDILNAQIIANKYFLQVELVSKVAESASSTLKKLQNAQ